MDSTIAENIENMPLKMIISPWIRMSECALNGRFAYVTYIDAFPPHVNDMTS